MSLARRVPTAFWVVLLPYLALVARFDFVADDALISFRYSKYLAAGEGLRYNLGVEPPVEGFSNLLWVLAMAVFEWLGANVPLWSRILSVLCGLALLWIVARTIERRVSKDPWVVTCALLFLATLPAFAVWSTSGLATMPFTLLVFCAFLALSGDEERPHGVRAGLFFVALTLLRADGPLFVALILSAAGLKWLLGGRSRPLFNAAWVALGVFVLGLAAQLAWRYAYFGDFAPNTAHAKVGLSATVLHRGFNYVAVFLLTFLSVPLVGLLALRGASRPRGGLMTQSLVLIGGTFAYAILVGGDFMCMHRFLITALPFVALVAARGMARWAEGSGRPVLLGLTGLTLALSLLPGWNVHVVPRSVREVFHYRWRVENHKSEYGRWDDQKANTAEWTAIGRALAMHTQPGESLVIGHIGAIGYYTDLVILDRKGLVNREVAKFVAPAERQSPGHDIRAPLSFFAPDEPTYMNAHIIVRPQPEPEARRRFRELFNEFEEDDELRHLYENVVIPLEEKDGFEPDSFLWLARRIRPS